MLVRVLRSEVENTENYVDQQLDFLFEFCKSKLKYGEFHGENCMLTLEYLIHGVSVEYSSK